MTAATKGPGATRLRALRQFGFAERIQNAARKARTFSTRHFWRDAPRASLALWAHESAQSDSASNLHCDSLVVAIHRDLHDSSAGQRGWLDAAVQWQGPLGLGERQLRPGNFHVAGQHDRLDRHSHRRDADGETIREFRVATGLAPQDRKSTRLN